MLELGLKFTLGYGLGGVMGALVVGRLLGGADIRSVGSGNVGATNALRAYGKAPAAAVMLIDVGKGILAAALIPGLRLPGVGLDPEVGRELLVYAVAFAAILGHVFPVWFDFRGGKGGATAAGLLCYLAPAVAVPIIGAWVLVALVTGYVGLATITAAIAAAAYVGILGWPEQQALFIFACCVALVIVFTHRGNIERMINGTESRFHRFLGPK